MLVKYIQNIVYFHTSTAFQKTSDLEEFAPRIVKALPIVVTTSEGELTRLVLFFI